MQIVTVYANRAQKDALYANQVLVAVVAKLTIS
jgi:hypothetical protein